METQKSPHKTASQTTQSIPKNEEKSQTSIVNVVFRGKPLLVNKILSEEDLDLLEKGIPCEETVKFVVVGDLNLRSKYAKTFLVVTDGKIYGFDPTFEGGMRTYAYSDLKRAYVKRCYGNAILVFSEDSSDAKQIDHSKGYVNFIRFFPFCQIETILTFFIFIRTKPKYMWYNTYV